MKRKLFVLLSMMLCFTMLFGMTGCKKGPVTLTFWHIWGAESDANYAAVKKVIADFENENPDIKINVETFENEAYKTTIKTTISGTDVPDVFSTWGGGFSSPFVDAGKVLNLDSYLNDGTKNKLKGGTLGNVTYDGSVYGLPFGVSCGALFCNTELFDQYGIDIPTTYEELLDACDKFLAQGVKPLCISGEKWTIAMYFDAMALKTVGSDGVIKTLTKETSGGFNDPNFLLAAQKLTELIDKGAFIDGAAGLNWSEANTQFLTGKVPMLFNGSWMAGSIEDTNGDSTITGGIVKPVGFPVISGGNGNANQFTGGAADAVMVSESTKNPEEAVKFLKYFCENMSRETYIGGSYLPAWNTDVQSSNPVTIQLAEMLNSAESYALWWDNLLAGDDATTYLNALEELFVQQITPEGFVDKLKAINP